MSTNELPGLTARQKFAQDLKEVKAELPKNWRELFIQKYPAYNTLAGGKKLDSVFYGYASDVAVLSGMQVIAWGYVGNKKGGENVG